MTLTNEQTARTLYYLKCARQRVAAQLADAEVCNPAAQLEYAKIDEIIGLLQQELETCLR